MQAPALDRDELASALALNLIGPDGAAHADEILGAAPSAWYLTCWRCIRRRPARRRLTALFPAEAHAMLIAFSTDDP